MLFAITSAISESFAIIVDKFNLNLKNISGQKYTTFLFLFMAALSLPLLFFVDFSKESLAFFPFLALIGIIFGSAIQNVFLYVGLKNRDLSYIEPIRNSEPILIILIAFLLFPSERNMVVLLLGVFTTLALIYSHTEKNEVKKMRVIFDKYALIVLTSMFLAAFINVGYKYVLEFYSPLFLMATRTIGVAIILALAFKPKITELQQKQNWLFFLSAVLYSVASILKYFAITKVGLSLTIIILTLSPAIIYIFSKLLLKEKLTLNKVIASVAIIACVVFASIFL